MDKDELIKQIEEISPRDCNNSEGIADHVLSLIAKAELRARIDENKRVWHAFQETPLVKQRLADLTKQLEGKNG